MCLDALSIVQLCVFFKTYSTYHIRDESETSAGNAIMKVSRKRYDFMGINSY